MKKPFYPRTNTAGLLRRVSLVSLVAGIVIIILLFLRFVIPSAFFFLATPFSYAGTALTEGVDQLWGGLSSKQALMRQAETAQSERDALFQENQTLKASLADIQKVVEGVGAENITVIAGVIARPPISPYDTLTISIPVSYSPNNGTLVVGTGGAPIGTITEVAGGVAKVQLFSEKGRETAGWVGESRIPANIVGTGTGSFETILPGDASVNVGDAIHIPGPGALFLGNVVRVTKDDTTGKLRVLIRAAVNPSALTHVGILKP